MKQEIQIIRADGSIAKMKKTPTLKEMQEIVGGLVEHVRVLDHIDDTGRLVYTSMFVNEEGLLKHLPRNEKATEIYQRNTKAQFPYSDNPFKDARQAYRKHVEARGFTYIDGTPKDVKDEGYQDSPWIAGDAIFFSGYTVEEADEAITKAA